MTTQNLNDETRVMNNENNQDNEATRVAGADELEATVTDVNPAAPVSEKAMKKSQWASRAAFGVAGAAAGFAAGYAVSAQASPASKGDPKLAPAADPEAEEPADTNKIEDPNALGNNLSEAKPAEEEIKLTVEENEPVMGKQTETENVVNNVTEHASEVAGAHVAHEAHQHAAAASVSPVSPAPAQDNHASQIVDVTPEQPAVPAHEEIHSQVSATEVEGTIPNASEIILQNENGIRYAQVDDDMSFGEAFATARQQVGAPGVFTWHGNTYGTYYAEEWNAMSSSERGDFLAAVDYPQDLNREADIVDVVPEPEYNPAYDLDIQIVEVSQTMDADGNITSTAHMTVNGVDVHMVDLDGNNVMDVALVDVDGDGEFTAGVDALLPVTDANVTVDDFVQSIQESNLDMIADGIDTATDDLAQADFNADAPADF